MKKEKNGKNTIDIKDGGGPVEDKKDEEGEKEGSRSIHTRNNSRSGIVVVGKGYKSGE